MAKITIGDIQFLLGLIGQLAGLLGLGVKRIKSIEEARALAKTLPKATPLPASGDADADWAAAQAETTASERKAAAKKTGKG